MAATNTLSIFSNSFPSLDTAFDEDGTIKEGVYYSLEPYGQPPRLGPPRYIEIPRSYVAVAGSAMIRMYPFGNQRMECDLTCVGSTKQAAEALWEGLLTSFTQLARDTIIMPSNSSYDGFKIIQGSGKINRQDNAGGMVLITGQFQFERWSDTNS